MNSVIRGTYLIITTDDYGVQKEYRIYIEDIVKVYYGNNFTFEVHVIDGSRYTLNGKTKIVDGRKIIPEGNLCEVYTS